MSSRITAVLALVLVFTADAGADQRSRLLFAQSVGDHCDVGIWDSANKTATTLITVDQCPEDLFTHIDSREAYVVDGDSLRVVSLDGSGGVNDIPLPDLNWRSWVEQMEMRPDRHANYLPSLDTMKPILAGKLDDGSIAFAASIWMPADDEYHYVFRFDGDSWSIVGNRWCGRWGCEEPLPVLSGNSTDLWTWPETRRVWNDAIASNPYVKTREVDSANSIHTLTFDVDDTVSVLRAYVGPSAHFDLTYTFGLELSVADSPFVNLSKNQCMTSVVGRYLLVMEFFKGRFEVTDLGTGNTVIGDLVAAMWLD